MHHTTTTITFHDTRFRSDYFGCPEVHACARTMFNESERIGGSSSSIVLSTFFHHTTCSSVVFKDNPRRSTIHAITSWNEKNLLRLYKHTLCAFCEIVELLSAVMHLFLPSTAVLLWGGVKSVWKTFATVLSVSEAPGVDFLMPWIGTTSRWLS